MQNSRQPEPSRPVRILVGGVPFGCHNVGDEAILECTIRILRELCPRSHITVSTADGAATARKFGVETCALFGFSPPESRAGLARILRQHDVFLWGGATGLSDYPEIPLRWMARARAAGNRIVLWGVGMNSVLNPAKYKVLPGRRRRLLSLIERLAFKRIDAIGWVERRWDRGVREQIARGLNTADLIVVRDPETREELRRCGVGREIVVGADPALALEAVDLSQVALAPAVRGALASDQPKVGVSISTSAPQFRDIPGLIESLDRMVADGRVRLVFLPMDPKVDAALLANIQARMKHPDRSVLVEGRYEPAEILAIVSRLQVVISSRLHLLIMASIAEVPFVGISPGSKLDSFMRPYGLHPVGTVTNCDFDRLGQETGRLLAARETCVARIRQVQGELLQRLAAAKVRLKAELERAGAETSRLLQA